MEIIECTAAAQHSGMVAITIGLLVGLTVGVMGRFLVTVLKDILSKEGL